MVDGKISPSFSFVSMVPVNKGFARTNADPGQSDATGGTGDCWSVTIDLTKKAIDAQMAEAPRYLILSVWCGLDRSKSE